MPLGRERLKRCSGGICPGVGAIRGVPRRDFLTSFRRSPVGSRNRDSARREGQMIMTDNPVDLDEYRGMAAQKSTEIRRRLHDVEADQAALRRRQEEFERHAVAAPSATWPEAAPKARYLIQLFAATLDARDPRRQELIAKVLDDLARLSE